MGVPEKLPLRTRSFASRRNSGKDRLERSSNCFPGVAENDVLDILNCNQNRVY